ncbi:MAG: hypothetical protein Q9227_002257 [Pyrenula ochraceoflavens]
MAPIAGSAVLGGHNPFPMPHRIAEDLEAYSEPDVQRDSLRNSVELPSIRDQFRQDQLPQFQGITRELLPSILSSSPPNARSSTLPPLHRKDKLQRPRKPSVGQNARKAKHERNKSKELGRYSSLDGRKAMSAEPSTAAWVQGKRWEDLIEAATSATEVDDDRDLTPVSHLNIIPYPNFVELCGPSGRARLEDSRWCKN